MPTNGDYRGHALNLAESTAAARRGGQDHQRDKVLLGDPVDQIECEETRHAGHAQTRRITGPSGTEREAQQKADHKADGRDRTEARGVDHDELGQEEAEPAEPARLGAEQARDGQDRSQGHRPEGLDEERGIHAVRISKEGRRAPGEQDLLSRDSAFDQSEARKRIVLATSIGWSSAPPGLSSAKSVEERARQPRDEARLGHGRHDHVHLDVVGRGLHGEAARVADHGALHRDVARLRGDRDSRSPRCPG